MQCFAAINMNERNGMMGLTGLILASMLLVGCAAHVAVMPASSPLPVSSQITRLWWRNDPLNRAIIYRHRLASLIREDSERALAELQSRVTETNSIEERIALADLTVRYAQKLGRTNAQKALAFYLSGAASSFRQLVARDNSSSINPWSYRFRKTYNQATAGVLTMLQTVAGAMRTNHVVAACGRSFRLEAASGTSSFELLNYYQWLPADCWGQTGLHARHRNDGLGARLIAFRTNRLATPLELHRPDEGIFDLREPASARGGQAHPQTAPCATGPT
jgi:hypothetical protein